MAADNGVDPEKTRELATELETAFPWGETDEGRRFWIDIQERLLRIAERGH